MQPPLDNHTARLHHKLYAEISARRQVERENLRLRQELARLQQRLRKAGLAQQQPYPRELSSHGKIALITHGKRPTYALSSTRARRYIGQQPIDFGTRRWPLATFRPRHFESV